jgi:hypothetical protein
MKVGSELQIVGEVRYAGDLVDISAWTIRADIRSGSETGAVVGSFTVTRPSLGVYVLTKDTSSLAVGSIFTDVRLIKPGGSTIITESLSFALTPAITA